MKKKYLLFAILILVLALVGCNENKVRYHVYVTGVRTSPDHVKVGETFALYASVSEHSTPNIETTYYWDIEGYDETLTSSGNMLNGLKFDTPGRKYGIVTAKSNHPDVLRNDLHFTFKVYE